MSFLQVLCQMKKAEEGRGGARGSPGDVNRGVDDVIDGDAGGEEVPHPLSLTHTLSLFGVDSPRLSLAFFPFKVTLYSDFI